MSNLTQQVKQGAEQALSSLAQGWREIRDRANGALTHFQPKDEKQSDGGKPPLPGAWGLMAVDVSDGKAEVVVRVEAPGMNRSDFKIELRGETLFIQGEKRIDHEFRGDGYHTIQSSYGSFQRAVPVPSAVSADKASATYRDGVLRILLPKVGGSGPRSLTVPVKEATAP